MVEFIDKCTKEYLETFYKVNDPWGYEVNKEDSKRKQVILSTLQEYHKDIFKTALDIGCGQGFITRDIPADYIEGLESDNGFGL